MLRKLLRALGLLLLLLIIVNCFVILSVRRGIIDFDNRKLPPAPEGMRYMDYCDGGQSDILVQETDDGCIADYPGDFAISTTASLSIIFFTFFSMMYISVLLFKQLLSKVKNLHVE